MAKKPSRKILLILMIAVIVLLILILPGALKREVPPQPTATAAPTQTPAATAAPTQAPTAEPTAAPLEVPETQPPNAEITAGSVLVATTEYELSYSGSMADIISYNEIPETPLTDLAFHVRMGERSEKIFTLAINSEEGDIISMMADPSGNEIPVAFIMDELPPGLTPEEEDIFCRAQETVNEILSSIVLR